jgi:hypothetical protein
MTYSIAKLIQKRLEERNSLPVEGISAYSCWLMQS